MADYLKSHPWTPSIFLLAESNTPIEVVNTYELTWGSCLVGWHEKIAVEIENSQKSSKSTSATAGRLR